MQRKVFVCCLSDSRDESSIGFALTLLCLPPQLPEDAQLHVHFCRSAEEGLQAYYRLGPCADDVVVVMSTMVEGQNFIPAALASEHQYVLGVHPETHIDWGRVAKGLPPCTTNLKDLSDAAAGYVPTHAAPPPPQDSLAFWVRGSVFLELGHWRVWEWKGDVHADTRNQLSVLGKHAFTGCVGHKLTIR